MAGWNRSSRYLGDSNTTLPDRRRQPQRLLAFGTWLAPEPSIALEHAVRQLRESGESFCCI